MDATPNGLNSPGDERRLPPKPLPWIAILMAFSAVLLAAGVIAAGIFLLHVKRQTIAEARWRLDSSNDLKGEEGIAACTEVIDALERWDPHSDECFRAHLRRAKLRHLTRDKKGAVADATRAIELRPEDSETWQAYTIRARDRDDGPAATIRDADEAIRLLGDRQTGHGDSSPYTVRAEAKIAVGDFDGALADHDEALRKCDHRCEAILFSRARAHALLGHGPSAFADLEESVRIRPNEYGAVWLALFGDSSMLSRFDSGSSWQSTIVRYVEGTITRDELLAEAKTGKTEQERREQLCEAHMYIGAMAERDGDLVSAKACYEACVATGVRTFIEFEWARARLAQLADPKQAGRASVFAR